MEYASSLRRLTEVDHLRVRNRTTHTRNRRTWIKFTDEELYERIRFNHRTFGKLVDILTPHLTAKSSKNDCLTEEERIYITLYFYASGSFQKVVGDSFGIHKSTI